MTTRSANSRTVTIFEGPDGAGKSTLAQEYADLTGAKYIHHGPYKSVTDRGLSRMFVESMLPALHGYQDVVLDRCWISEPIYADAFRNGNDRVGPGASRQLDRLAMRCGAVVVKCLPPWAHVKACFNGRKGEEYLEDDNQLLSVYGQYQHDLNTHLHEVEYDYTKHVGQSLSLVATGVRSMVEHQRNKNPPHKLCAHSAGNRLAPILLVGDSFAERKDQDPMYQWPFGSLSGVGCSKWLSRQLDEAAISEQSLCWINADELTELWLDQHPFKTVVALGDSAFSKLSAMGSRPYAPPHPQYWKRFKHSLPYPLIDYLKEHLP